MERKGVTPDKTTFSDYESLLKEPREPHGVIPYLKDIVSDRRSRENTIVTPDQRGGAIFPGEYLSADTHEATERDHLQRLVGYLEQTITICEEHPEDEETAQIKQSCEDMLEHAVYIGEQELHEAVGGLADHWRSLAEMGQDVVVLADGQGLGHSQSYIALLALERFEADTEDPAMLQKVSVAQKFPADMRERIQRDDKVVYVLTDDVIISGSQMKNRIGYIMSHMEGVDRETVESHLEIDVIARRDNTELEHKWYEYRGRAAGEPGRYIKSYSYFQLPKPRVHWAAVTSSHSSTDYGFENVLREVDKYNHRVAGLNRLADLPVAIQRPYTTEDDKYADPELKERWSAMFERRGLK